jgi:hypothetical protein
MENLMLVGKSQEKRRKGRNVRVKAAKGPVDGRKSKIDAG